MDVKEKLVELLGRVQQMGVIYRENQMDERYPTIEQIRNTEVAARLIANGVTVQEWIPVTERFPDEHESLFASYKGTDKWRNAMFTTISDRVIVCAEYENGERIVKTANTIDGNWKVKDSFYPCRVTHWMPFPEMPQK